MSTFNVKCSKHCAFCKHWYDPAWCAIKPLKPTAGMWSVVDERTRRMCLKRDADRAPMEFCNDFKCKIDW